jgi:Fic family protein
MRSGRYVRQLEGYSAFIPEPLPPDPPIEMDDGMRRLLSRADRALGRLDGVASVLPNPDLFVAMYVRHEAVLSSQIEGTQSTLGDVLEFEAAGRRDSRPKDVEEVVNYVGALNYGLERLNGFPLCLRLLREIHERLLEGVRGQHRTPGEFRTSQNWLGPEGCLLSEADYIPPPPHEMKDSLGNLEEFLHDEESFPVLIHCAMAHAQFETIHPFLDGNGRVGRLLITLLLCQRGVLGRPLLYLSYYLRAHRAMYYDRLTAVRNDGDWEAWIKFFLRGVYETSESATATARDILALREAHRERIGREYTGSAYGLRLLDYLYERPLLTIGMARKELGCAYTTASNLIERFAGLGILVETTGRQRNRRYSYRPYLDLFERQVIPGPAASTGGNVPTTESAETP